MSTTQFERRLSQGRAVESLIAQFLMRQHYLIFPAYEIIQHEHKGPRVFSAESELVAPDLLVFRFWGEKKRVFWAEAKSKEAFTWHRISQTYQDGIDKRHWLDYLELRRRMPWDLWLLFLHAPGGVAKDNPEGMVPPSGLFGGEIQQLARCVDHEADNYGKGGMVYWRCADLMPKGRPIASYEDVARGQP